MTGIRKLLYVVFCVGCMLALSLVVKYAVNSMSPVFLAGFIAGCLFVIAVWTMVHYLDRKDGRYRSGPDIGLQ